ncbi:MAG TPA: KpsF/GutQ family sugar-phosphate isomerase [Xanthobacteraceae bacterium]|jgi:arabinose-5-phosphate isomerase|nr:KpsF/GutQ family sugar-phosphate isomerase [Xanthobacteraceae bacterium]
MASPHNQISQHADSINLLESALRTLKTEADGLEALCGVLKNGLGTAFIAAVDLLRATRGRVIVTGMGKSGHIGRKIAATLASTGTPAYFVHPGEASHGDLGMISRDDAIIALSWSGETMELRDLIEYAKRFKVALVAVTSGADSTLAKAADVLLLMPKVTEACPLGLAPTTSALIQLALGDAIAVALFESRGFTALDFKALHPGGKLGATLTYVRDIMRKEDGTPLVPSGTRMSDAIVEMTAKGFGCVGIVGTNGDLAGIITDGDLRRHMSENLLSRTVDEVMTKNPKTIRPDQLAGEAMGILNAMKVNVLFVVENRKPIGLVRFHDLLRIGVA